MPSLRRYLLELRGMNVTPGEIELDDQTFEDLLRQAEEISGQSSDEADDDQD